MRFLLYLIIVYRGVACFSQALPALALTSHEAASSFRGIAVSPNGTVWVSGSNGTYGWSNDQGGSWQFKQVPGFENAEFRDIELLTDSSIVLMSSAEPAAILISRDAGKNFSTAYFSQDSSVFLDGMDFFDSQHGVCYGDPISGRMMVLQSGDGGRSWSETHNGPLVSEGTAAFAASGSGIWYLDQQKILMVTGGQSSDIYQSLDGGLNWQLRAHLPFASGQSSGAFSMCFTDTLHGYVVGGDYTKADDISNNCFYTTDGGYNWLPAVTMPKGYRSVIVANKEYVVVAGTSGIDSASPLEMKFEFMYPFSFNTAIIHENMLYLVGSDGFIGSIQLQ